MKESVFYGMKWILSTPLIFSQYALTETDGVSVKCLEIVFCYVCHNFCNW